MSMDRSDYYIVKERFEYLGEDYRFFHKSDKVDEDDWTLIVVWYDEEKNWTIEVTDDLMTIDDAMATFFPASTCGNEIMGAFDLQIADVDRVWLMMVTQ